MPHTTVNGNWRFKSLDFLRGIALILIVFFHSSIYNYANIHLIDFTNPPVVVVLMSFMALWGGMLIVYSGLINTVWLFRRSSSGKDYSSIRYILITAGLYFGLHYILNIVLGRWNNDFVHNRPDMTMIAGTLRNGYLALPKIDKYFEGSSLSTIAFNLILVTWLVRRVTGGNGQFVRKSTYFALTGVGIFIMVFSYVRVVLYPLFPEAVNSGNYLLATFYSFTLANPYPLIPYVAYGIFGAVCGLAIVRSDQYVFKRVVVPVGLFFLFFGIFGMSRFPKTISKPDYFWYFKTQFELGVFLLSTVAVYALEHQIALLSKISGIIWFSRLSLTIYMLETLVSELLRNIAALVNPDWNQTINGCLVFGGINVLFWFTILKFWKKYGFRYSLEYFWVKFFQSIGKPSTKMAEMP